MMVIVMASIEWGTYAYVQMASCGGAQFIHDINKYGKRLVWGIFSFIKKLKETFFLCVWHYDWRFFHKFDTLNHIKVDVNFSHLSIINMLSLNLGWKINFFIFRNEISSVDRIANNYQCKCWTSNEMKWKILNKLA